MPDRSPQFFSPTEHLQDQVKRLVNKSVVNYFRDVGDKDWKANLSTLPENPRASLRLACTHQELDTIDMTITRLLFYYITVRRDELIESAIYGIPIPGYQSSVRFLPQINLFFKEKLNDVAVGQSPVTGEISFRLKESEVNTDADLTSIGRKIKSAFGGHSPQAWEKGRDCLAYLDKDRVPPLQLKIYCSNKSAGKSIIASVFQVIDGNPDWSKAHYSQNESEAEAYPIVPESKSILGKTRKLPRRRPRASVYLQYATAHVWGIPNPICVYDRSGRFGKALVKD